MSKMRCWAGCTIARDGVIYHLKRIEDSLDVTSQSEVTP